MESKSSGLFIAEHRKKLGLTQSELAVKLNVSDKAVSRWERGVGFPNICTLGLLASILNVSALEMLDILQPLVYTSGMTEKSDVDYAQIAFVMHECVQTIKYKPMTDKRYAASKLHRYLIYCTALPELDDLTGIYKDKPCDISIGYEPLAVTQFVHKLYLKYAIIGS